MVGGSQASHLLLCQIYLFYTVPILYGWKYHFQKFRFSPNVGQQLRLSKSLLEVVNKRSRGEIKEEGAGEGCEGEV